MGGREGGALLSVAFSFGFYYGEKTDADGVILPFLISFSCGPCGFLQSLRPRNRRFLCRAI